MGVQPRNRTYTNRVRVGEWVRAGAPVRAIPLWFPLVRGASLLRCRVVEYSSTGVLEYWIVAFVGSWSTGVLENWSPGVLEHAELRSAYALSHIGLRTG